MKPILVLLLVWLTIAAAAITENQKTVFVEAKGFNDKKVISKAIFSEFIEINASAKIWSMMINYPKIPKADASAIGPVRWNLGLLDKKLCKLAARVGAGDITREFDVQYAMNELEPKVVETLKSWRGRVRIVVDMNFTPNSAKMLPLNKNLIALNGVLDNFVPPGPKLTLNIKISPTANAVKVTRSPDGAVWGVMVPAYVEIRAADIKLPTVKQGQKS